MAGLALVLSILPVLSATNAPPPPAAVLSVAKDTVFNAGELQLDANAFTRTRPGLDDFDNGGGFGVNYFPWRKVGIGADFQAEDTSSAFFDRIGVAAIFRLPIEKLRIAPELKFGYDYDFEAGDSDHASAGAVEKSWKKPKPTSSAAGDDSASGHEIFASIGAEWRPWKSIGFGVEARGVKPEGRSEYLLGIVRVRKTF